MTAAGHWMVPTVMLRRPAKRHPRRLLIWLPRRTVQAQGSSAAAQSAFAAECPIPVFGRTVPDAVRCAFYPCCSIEDVAMRKIGFAPSGGGIEPAHGLELSTIRLG